jgi:hypothetical protein
MVFSSVCCPTRDHRRSTRGSVESRPVRRPRRSGGRCTARARVSDLRQLPRLDQVHEDVPLGLLKHHRASRLTDSYLVALDLHLRTIPASPLLLLLGRPLDCFGASSRASFELRGVERHDFHAIPVGVVLPAEAHEAVGEAEEPVDVATRSGRVRANHGMGLTRGADRATGEGLGDIVPGKA